MATAVQICNMALSHLGKNSITSLTESTTEAQKCNLFYSQVVDSVLQSAFWNFAKMTEAGTELADETVPGYDFLYQKPSKCLFVRKVFVPDAEDVNNPDPYEVVMSPTTKQTAIASNLEDAYICYTYQITDPTAFPAIFVEAVALKLAASMAQVLVGDYSLAQRLSQAYSGVMAEARRLNATEDVAQPSGTGNSYLDAR